MKCVTCKHGNTSLGKVAITYVQKETTVVIKEVPAQVCDLCGAYYLDLDTIEEVRKVVNEESKSGHEISVVNLNKAA